jgi:hypothetical protein
MILCSVLIKTRGKLEPSYWLAHLQGLFLGLPALRQFPDNATHVELTVSHSELIVSDSELTSTYIPFIFYIIYIYHWRGLNE